MSFSVSVLPAQSRRCGGFPARPKRAAMAGRTVGRERSLRRRNRLYCPRNLQNDGAYVVAGHSRQPIDLTGASVEFHPLAINPLADKRISFGRVSNPSNGMSAEPPTPRFQVEHHQSRRHGYARRYGGTDILAVSSTRRTGLLFLATNQQTTGK